MGRAVKVTSGEKRPSGSALPQAPESTPPDEDAALQELVALARAPLSVEDDDES